MNTFEILTDFESSDPADYVAKQAKQAAKKKPKTDKKSVQARKNKAQQDQQGYAAQKPKNTRKRTDRSSYKGRGRQFDKKSGTGRGKETRKQGAGKYGWGKATDSKVEEVEEKVAEEQQEEPEKVEVDNSVTYEEYLKTKKVAYATKSVKKVDNEKLEPSLKKKMTALKKDVAEIRLTEKKVNKTRQRKNKKTFDAFAEAPKTGYATKKSGYNKNRQRGGRRPDTNSNNDFPAL